MRIGTLCYASQGFSLHAATRVEATDRPRLERLCRYVVRPPVAARRLRIVDDATLVFRLKTPWADGTTSLVLSPTELIEKLAALVPPRRTNLIRYHGVLAPVAQDRDRIVPGPSQLTAAGDAVDAAGDATDDTAARRHRVEWAKLPAMVLQVDVTCCPACGGHMKIIAAITAPPSIHKVLDALGLPSRSPPVAPARFQQLELDAA